MLGDKTFKEYFQIIKIPLLIYILWSLLYTFVDFILRLLGLLGMLGEGSWIFGIIAFFPTLFGMGVGLILYLYVGWSAAKKHKGLISTGAVAGLFAGLVTGMVAALLEGTKSLLLRITEFILLGDLAPLYIYFFLGALAGILFKVAIFIFLGLVLGMLFGAIGAVVGGARK